MLPFVLCLTSWLEQDSLFEWRALVKIFALRLLTSRTQTLAIASAESLMMPLAAISRQLLPTAYGEGMRPTHFTEHGPSASRTIVRKRNTWIWSVAQAHVMTDTSGTSTRISGRGSSSSRLGIPGPFSVKQLPSVPNRGLTLFQEGSSSSGSQMISNAWDLMGPKVGLKRPLPLDPSPLHSY